MNRRTAASKLAACAPQYVIIKKYGRKSVHKINVGDCRFPQAGTLVKYLLTQIDERRASKLAAYAPSTCYHKKIRT